MEKHIHTHVLSFPNRNYIADILLFQVLMESFMRRRITGLSELCEIAKKCFYSKDKVLAHLLKYIEYLGEFIHAYTYAILTENLTYPSIFYNSDYNTLFIRRASGDVEIQFSRIQVMVFYYI